METVCSLLGRNHSLYVSPSLFLTLFWCSLLLICFFIFIFNFYFILFALFLFNLICLIFIFFYLPYFYFILFALFLFLFYLPYFYFISFALFLFYLSLYFPLLLLTYPIHVSSSAWADIHSLTLSLSTHPYPSSTILAVTTLTDYHPARTFAFRIYVTVTAFFFSRTLDSWRWDRYVVPKRR